MKSYKYGLFHYNTENIGDEIQSIAARRFLPKIDYYFDRDDIDATVVKSGEKVKLIMNGWYTHKPELWPPKTKSIEPLLISMFVEQTEGVNYSAKAFSSPESVKFLNKFGPVGARDLSSRDFFNSIGVESYFSGCLTLTLIADKRVKKQDFILAVDVSDAVYNKVSSLTDRKIVRLDTYRLSDLTYDEKFKLAEYWLMLYQSAHVVVTPRLHCMLPCLALETPVIAISGRDPRRYNGLIDLTNHYTEEEFTDKSFKYDFEHPVSNPTKYKELRKNVEERCSTYTGFDSKASYIAKTNPEELLFDPSLLNALGKSVAGGFELDEIRKEQKTIRETLAKEEAQFNRRIATLVRQNEELTERNTELENLGIKGSAVRLVRANKNFIKKKFGKK